MEDVTASSTISSFPHTTGMKGHQDLKMSWAIKKRKVVRRGALRHRLVALEGFAVWVSQTEQFAAVDDQWRVPVLHRLSRQARGAAVVCDAQIKAA